MLTAASEKLYVRAALTSGGGKGEGDSQVDHIPAGATCPASPKSPPCPDQEINDLLLFSAAELNFRPSTPTSPRMEPTLDSVTHFGKHGTRSWELSSDEDELFQECKWCDGVGCGECEIRTNSVGMPDIRAQVPDTSPKLGGICPMLSNWGGSRNQNSKSYQNNRNQFNENDADPSVLFVLEPPPLLPGSQAMSPPPLYNSFAGVSPTEPKPQGNNLKLQSVSNKERLVPTTKTAGRPTVLNSTRPEHEVNERLQHSLTENLRFTRQLMEENTELRNREALLRRKLLSRVASMTETCQTFHKLCSSE
jgi:hypothetical protein